MSKSCIAQALDSRKVLQFIATISFVVISSIGNRADAQKLLDCPYAAPNEPVSLMTCSDLSTTKQVAETFGALFSRYERLHCNSASPPMFIPVPSRELCEGTNRILRELDNAASRGQQPAVPADWEPRLRQLIAKTKENWARYETIAREQTAIQKQQQDAASGGRKNETASFELLLSRWKNNVNVEERRYAALAAWWRTSTPNFGLDPAKMALTTCVDWIWLEQSLRPAWKSSAMVLEPLFEHCYSNHTGVAAVPLEKVEAVFFELNQSRALPADEVVTWKKAFLVQSDINFRLLTKVVEARRKEQQREKETARLNALTPEQKKAELARRQDADNEVYARNCAMYKHAYQLAYRAGDAYRAANALDAMRIMGCL